MAQEFFDVVIVGAGLSGVGAAHYLQAQCPDRSYVILEGREAIGGTWDIFRYPGIRSDSDMYTLGYAFRPWEEQKAIADGPSILKYVRATASEGGIDQHIRFGHQVKGAAWSTKDATWTVEAIRDGKPVQIRCNFIFLCGGYYSYEGGYSPEFPGAERFKGTVIHPQQWPEDLDYSGKRVVVIGSGATAMTLVPAMTDKAAQVTMLQRSPTYVVSMPAEDRLALLARKLLPAKAAYALTRWRKVVFQQYFYGLTRRKPQMVKQRIVKMVRDELGPDYDVEKHFTPSYNPWDQRVCLVPDADLFKALKSGAAEVVTDHIETFTETGIQLKSGRHLDADIIVTATGLVLQPMNGMALSVDGKTIEPSETVAYRGMMYSDVPNLASWFGYTNASWTLKADLTSEYVCRLLNHMKATGLRQATPRLDDPSMERRPWLDFSSGYVRRAIDRFPRQGTKAPWMLHQNYFKDIKLLRKAPIEDGVLEFSNPAVAAKEPASRKAA